jgi:NAD+ synthase
MMDRRPFSAEVLAIDAAVECDRIARTISTQVLERLKRRGAVVALSGGIDSSVVAALCVRALGKDRVFGLCMPERESSDETRRLGRLMVEMLGIASADEDITCILDSAGCYRRRDAAIASVVPGYGPGWASKIVLPSVVESDAYRVFSVVARAPDGREARARLPPQAYLDVVASTNFKQRVRKMLEYHWADRLAYAVAGTPNLLEYDQGFFVKLGDGSADLKPIAHLYKSQVYALAEELGAPVEIRTRAPTTDTYSLAQSQEEFYFSVPFRTMDLCLYARSRGIPASEVAPVVDLTPAQVERVFRDIDAKRKAAFYLRAPALLVEPLAGPDTP